MEDGEPQSKARSVFLSSVKEFVNILQQSGEGYAIMVQPKEEEKTVPTPIPKEVHNFLGKFKDIISDGTPTSLPPKRAIIHHIDFVPGASLPNKVAYKLTSEKNQEVARQV